MTNFVYSDVWSFSGGSWTEVVPSGGLTPRRSTAAVWDPMLQTMWGYGGTTINSSSSTVILEDIFLYLAAFGIARFSYDYGLPEGVCASSQATKV